MLLFRCRGARPIVDLDARLAPYRQLWNDRLDVLGKHLDDAEDS